jgi:hypothetical protein
MAKPIRVPAPQKMQTINVNSLNTDTGIANTSLNGKAPKDLLGDSSDFNANGAIAAGGTMTASLAKGLDNTPDKIDGMDYAANAASGAAAGAALGPIGAGVGAAVGLATTYLSAQKQREALAAQNASQGLALGQGRAAMQYAADGGVIGATAPVPIKIKETGVYDPYQLQREVLQSQHRVAVPHFDSSQFAETSGTTNHGLSFEQVQEIQKYNIKKDESNITTASAPKSKRDSDYEANLTSKENDRNNRLKKTGLLLKAAGKAIGSLAFFDPEHPIKSIPSAIAGNVLIGGIVGAIAKRAGASAKVANIEGELLRGAAGLAERTAGKAIGKETTSLSFAATKGVKGAETAHKVEQVKESGTAEKKAIGGSVQGAGTGTSDDVQAKLTPGDFVVPAKNAAIAQQLRSVYFGKGDTITQGDKKGSAPVALSNGEHVFTKNEVAVLQKNGVNLDRLAPNAEKTGYGYYKGGKIGGKEVQYLSEGGGVREKWSSKIEKLYKNVNVRAYLNAIMHGETDPNDAAGGKNPKSSATGYFQFLEGTNKSIKDKYGYEGQSSDISESAKAAIALMIDNGAADSIAKGDFEAADKRLKTVWTSLPGGKESNVKSDSIPLIRKEFLENKGEIKSVPGAKTYIPYEDPTNAKSTKNPDGKTGTVVSAIAKKQSIATPKIDTKKEQSDAEKEEARLLKEGIANKQRNEKEKLVEIQLRIAKEKNSGDNLGEHVERTKALKAEFDAQMKEYQKASNPKNYKREGLISNADNDIEYEYDKELADKEEARQADEQKKQDDVNKSKGPIDIYMPKEKPGAAPKREYNIPGGPTEREDLSGLEKAPIKGIQGLVDDELAKRDIRKEPNQYEGKFAELPKTEDEDPEVSLFTKLGGYAGLLAVAQTGMGLAGLASNKDPGAYKGDPNLSTQLGEARLDATRIDPAVRVNAETNLELTRRTRNAEAVRASAGDVGLALGATRESAIDKNRGIMQLAALEETSMEQKKARVDNRVDALSRDKMYIYDSKNQRFMANQQAASGLLNTGITNFIGQQNYSKYMADLAGAQKTGIEASIGAGFKDLAASLK